MRVDLALQMCEAPLLKRTLHLRCLRFLFSQIFLHFGLFFESVNGAAYLLLHQIERSGGSSELVPASYLERRRIILTDTDAVGGVTKLGDRPQHASDEDHQHNADHQRDDDEKGEQLTGAVPVSCGNLLPLPSALLHSSMQQIARIAVDIGRLRFHREILPHFLLIAVHRKQFILRLSVIDHCIADCLL